MECQPLSINKLKDAQGCQILGIFFRNNVGGSPHPPPMVGADELENF